MSGTVADAHQTTGGLAAQLAAIVGVVVYGAGNAFMAGGLGVAGRQFGVTEIEVGFILSLGALVAVLAAPAWGYASDIWSRRQLTLIAMPVIALGPLAMALAFVYAPVLSVLALVSWLAAARLVQATFGAALVPVAQSYVAEYTSPDRRVSGMGLLSIAVSVGALLGSLLLWATAGFGIVVGFVVVAIVIALGFVATLLFLPEGRARDTALPVKETSVPLRDIWPNFVLTFFGFLAYTLVHPILGYRLMDRLDLDATSAAAQAGLLLTSSAVALTIAQAIVATRQNWNATPMLRLGGAVALLGSIAMVLLHDVIGLALAMAVVGFALGFMFPANLAVISLSAGSGAQGKVGGINMAARSLGIAAGPITGTWLYGFSPEAPFVAAAAMVAIIVALTFVPQRTVA